MSAIVVGPETAKTVDELNFITIDGETFSLGDKVWEEHVPSGQKVFGTLVRFYGVGRIRGLIVDAPFAGEMHFPFGQPGDENYRLTKIEERS